MPGKAGKGPKIAVYAIACNEENLVRQWFENTKDADLHLIADNISTDNTYQIARSLGIKVHVVEVKPFRFDVARNAALALVPEDFDLCIQLDLHESLSPNWRQTIEDAWRSGNSWPSYMKVLSRDFQGRILKYEHGFSVHPRKDFIWTYPVHEFVMPSMGQQFTRQQINLEINSPAHHNQRDINTEDLISQYLSKSPRDWRMNYYNVYYGWLNSRWDSVIARGRFALSLTEGTSIERAAINLWVSESYLKLGQNQRAMEFANNATKLAPETYETWHWQAHVSHMKKDWQECFSSAIKIETLVKQNNQLTKPEVWHWWGYDLVALSAHYLGKHDLAVFYGKKALLARPEDKRLNENLKYYEKGYRENVGHRRHSRRVNAGSLQLTIKVINLEERLDRLGVITENLESDFEVIKAFSGSKIPEMITSNSLTRFQTQLLHGLISLSLNKAETLPGTFGKWNSHLKLWNELAYTSDNDNLVLVLEDDVIPGADASNRIAKLAHQTLNFDNILFAGKELQESNGTDQILGKSDEIGIGKVTILSHISESAYVIRRKGAVALLSALTQHLDEALPIPPLRAWLNQQSKSMDFHFMTNPIFVQNVGSADSDIGAHVR